MYHHVRGEVVSLHPTRVVLEAGGVGFELSIPLSTFQAIKGRSEARLLTHLLVREDAQRLFGFASESERELFRVLIAVSGVGPTIALSILSSFGVEEFVRTSRIGDPKPLQRIKGVGRRLADRLMVELKDRLSQITRHLSGPLSTSPTGNGGEAGEMDVAGEAALALVELGFDRGDAETRVGTALRSLGESSRGVTVESVLALVLRSN